MGVILALHVAAMFSHSLIKPARQAAWPCTVRRGWPPCHTWDKAEVSLEPDLQASGPVAPHTAVPVAPHDHLRPTPLKKAWELGAPISVALTLSESCDMGEQASIALGVKGSRSPLGPSPPLHIVPCPSIK